uniref:Retrovirus-related Pol polyprotein from transposon TNT 1-94 n=1 Tax=Nymphaea colorata TaxID=210225 RepID=A0A5K0V051_9MAGN
MSMDAYFQKVRVVAHQLAIASKLVDEDDLVLYILRGLPAEYLAFKISMETQKEPISLNELYGLLLMQEANQKGHNDEFLRIMFSWGTMSDNILIVVEENLYTKTEIFKAKKDQYVRFVRRQGM